MVGPGAPADRIEVPYLFNRLARVATDPNDVKSTRWARGTLILLTDEAHVSDAAWREVVARGRVVLLDGRAIVDLTPGHRPSLEELRWTATESYNPFMRYLHAPMHGPIQLRAGNAPHAYSVAAGAGFELRALRDTLAGRTPVLDSLPSSLRVPAEPAH